LFVKSTGAAAAAVAGGPQDRVRRFRLRGGRRKVFCTRAPVAQWMAITPDGASVGPPTPELPAGFRSQRFRRRRRGYIVGTGAKNLFGVHRRFWADVQDGDVQRWCDRL
jgi:hypothetical protein